LKANMRLPIRDQ